MALTHPYTGAIVLVNTPRDANNGATETPAVITRVWPDGTVDAQPFVPGISVRYTKIKLLNDRKAVNDLLKYHYQDLPGHSTVEDDDGNHTHVPGKNSMTGKPWHLSDVGHWVQVAWWPDGADKPELAAAADKPKTDQSTPADPAGEDPSAVRERELVAELAALRASRE